MNLLSFLLGAWVVLIVVAGFFIWHYWRFHRRLANIDEAFSRIQVVYDYAKRVKDETDKDGRAITDLQRAFNHLKTRVDKLEAGRYRNPGGPPQ